ncbi:MAG: hypothetical protein KAJ33_07225 [Thermoplasmata archaeon]|nr:hypothetical protein [Thermoplasmata archaeon]
MEGKLFLPEDVKLETLNPVGGVWVDLAGVEVADQSVSFEIKGKKGDKWEYKDKHNAFGNIKEFKVDWKRGKFKLVSAFDPTLLPDGTESLPDELAYEISLGEGIDKFIVSGLVGTDKAWTKKDDKHWEYK